MPLLSAGTTDHMHTMLNVGFFYAVKIANFVPYIVNISVCCFYLQNFMFC